MFIFPLQLCAKTLAIAKYFERVVSCAPKGNQSATGYRTLSFALDASTIRITRYCHISRDLKECVLRLWDSGWELEDLCLALGVSSRSCYHWRQIYGEDDCQSTTLPTDRAHLTGENFKLF